MMIKVYPYEQLGHASHGWLEARHHFSFAHYYNPKRMGFGALRVINDDIIQAGAGFETHPHRNMEIITYVRQGAITHKDSKGNEGRTAAGNIQVMSAGKGIFHSEYNLESEETKIFQIWITPNKQNLESTWDTHEFPKEITNNKLQLLVSGDGHAPMTINQDAYIYAGQLEKGTTITHPIVHQAYILVSKGTIELNDERVSEGDGTEITGEEFVDIHALEPSEILVLDVIDNTDKH